MNHFYYITSKEFDNIFLDGVIQWCVDFLLKCQLGCPAVQESDHLGQHVWCTLACAHISLFVLTTIPQVVRARAEAGSLMSLQVKNPSLERLNYFLMSYT